MNSSSPRSIAVIGGGASATLFAAALPARDFTIDIYDRTGAFARGIAYATPYDHHLLNVRAGNMSGFAADKDHFAQWAAGFGYTPTDFVPRRLYGDYLDELLQQAGDNNTIHKIQSDVMASTRHADGFSVNGKNYDVVVRATGNAVPLGPRVEGAVKGYFADPWTLTKNDIDGARNIALIGTGLSAVDAVLTLQSLGYNGHMTMISRRSLLPAPHVAGATWAHTPLSADDADKPLSHLLGMVRLHVREAAADNIPWQAVIDSLRAVTNPLWKGFDDLQRARFMKRLLTIWNIHRHRMAPEIAAQVDALQAQGRLTFLKESVTRVTNGPIIKGAQGDHAFDVVINCMGYRYQEPGRDYAYSYAIGPARFGDEWFETTAIPEVRAQAADVARAIAG